MVASTQAHADGLFHVAQTAVSGVHWRAQAAKRQSLVELEQRRLVSGGSAGILLAAFTAQRSQSELGSPDSENSPCQGADDNISEAESPVQLEHTEQGQPKARLKKWNNALLCSGLHDRDLIYTGCAARSVVDWSNSL